MSLNYNIIETLNLLLNVFKYDIFWAILISCILFIFAFILNKDKKLINYVILIVNLILIFLVGYYYMKDILTLQFSNPINNMYFYFFNTIVYLIIMSIVSFKTRYKNINYIFYGLSLIGILFSLFMTHYLNDVQIIVIGNIFPMIKFGNIIYFVYYILLIISLEGVLWKKK